MRKKSKTIEVHQPMLKTTHLAVDLDIPLAKVEDPFGDALYQQVQDLGQKNCHCKHGTPSSETI